MGQFFKLPVFVKFTNTGPFAAWFVPEALTPNETKNVAGVKEVRSSSSGAIRVRESAPTPICSSGIASSTSIACPSPVYSRTPNSPVPPADFRFRTTSNENEKAVDSASSAPPPVRLTVTVCPVDEEESPPSMPGIVGVRLRV